MTASHQGERGLLSHLVVGVRAVLFSPIRFVAWLASWLRWWGQTRRRRLMWVSLLASMVMAALGTRVAGVQVAYEQAAQHRVQSAETVAIPPPAALAVLSLGHRSMLADLLFARANMYFVSHLFSDRIYRWLDTYVAAILALDPDNPRVYEWASQAVKYGQIIDADVLERSNDYARQGIARFPDHWRFYFDIGFNYHIEWRAKSEEEKQANEKRALSYFSMAAALPDSRLDPNFVTELYLRRNEVGMALFHAYLRYWESSDREREALRGRITRYESEAAAMGLARTETRWKADYPYVPFGLYELLGPDRGLGVPTAWRATEEVHTLDSREDDT